MAIYEVIGAIDAGAVSAVQYTLSDEAILVEQEETSQYLIARPKGDGSEAE